MTTMEYLIALEVIFTILTIGAFAICFGVLASIVTRD